MSRRRGKITQYTSQALALCFTEKISSKFVADDSTHLMPKFSDNPLSMMDGFYVIGALPWEYTLSPRILYSFPENDESTSVYSQFVLPNGCDFQVESFDHVGEAIQKMFEEEHVDDESFINLYFPENRSAPYLFCYRFKVNPLTIPSFAHKLSLSELLIHTTHLVVPTCTICIAIKTRLPFISLFKTFVKWILDSERIARMQSFGVIDKYFHTYDTSDDESITMWPSIHRTSFEMEIINFLSSCAPDPGQTMIMDCNPFPIFEWVRPSYPKVHYELAKIVLFDLVKRSTPRMLTTIFGAMLLEKTIILYHPSERVVCNAVLALHFMLNPLKWVSGSISTLPKQLEDLLNAPNPFIIGTINPLSETPEYVYVDLESQDVSVGELDIAYPREATMERTFRDLWKRIDSPNSPELLEILKTTNGVVETMLASVATSIVTDFTDTKIQSKFFIELYLKHFVLDERHFMTSFCNTQMFQLHIEQECKKRSDTAGQSYNDISSP